MTTDYGLRTEGTLGLGRAYMCSVVPTVASSRRCVVEGFHVVQRGVVRETEDGMKKWSKVRKLRCSCTVTLELQTNAHLEQFQVLMNSEQRKMYGLLCLLILTGDFDRRVVFQNEIKTDSAQRSSNKCKKYLPKNYS